MCMNRKQTHIGPAAVEMDGMQQGLAAHGRCKYECSSKLKSWSDSLDAAQ